MGSTAQARVQLTNADKVLYPATGTTKADVFDYYTRIAEAMIPHTAGRPATRKRWPNGVDEDSFFEKQLASSAPDWLPRGSVTHRSGTTTYPIVDSLDGLAWIAQQAALEVHVPQWRFVAEWTRSTAEELRPGPATRLVFDLDPGAGVTMAQLAGVARAVRDLIADIGLTTFPLTSGSKGLHLYAPLAEPVSSRGAAVLAKRVAQHLEETMPTLVTATMTKSLRAGKVFVDWSQNNGAKTTIAPYSLRGQQHPTVAAPRTWEELEDAGLTQLRYDEVLARVDRDGDLLAPLDADAPVPDRLAKYRSMRDAAKTTEPVPVVKPVTGQGNTFVIQEHHARRLHYDFRLERNGVLVSWAVPKNLPETTSANHLAVHTEDHPLEYATFEGNIPKGEYGAGRVVIWDSGTYEAEKFRDSGEKGEVILNLHGNRISGRYALIQTNGDQWLVHRMKDQKAFDFNEIAPMLATHGSVSDMKAGQWAFEGKWDGYRVLLESDHGALRLRSRRGRDVTKNIPNSVHWQQISPITTWCSTARPSRWTPPVCPASTRCRTAAAPPASSIGRSTCSTSTAVPCCAHATPTGASCWKPWPARAISSFPTSSPARTARRRSRTPLNTVGRVWWPSGATPPTSRAGGRRHGSRTSTGTHRKSSSAAGRRERVDAATESARC